MCLLRLASNCIALAEKLVQSPARTSALSKDARIQAISTAYRRVAFPVFHWMGKQSKHTACPVLYFFHPPQVESASWNDSSDVLTAIADSRLVTWYYPNAVSIDRDLLGLASTSRDAAEFGKVRDGPHDACRHPNRRRWMHTIAWYTVNLEADSATVWPTVDDRASSCTMPYI